MAARKQSTEVRREQIVREALAIVARDGVSALDVARLSRRCGLVPSALYRHFRGRDEILDAVLASLRERLRANVEAARAASPRALERLRRLYSLHLALAAGGAALPRVVFSEEVSQGSPARRSLVYAVLREYLDGVAAVVDEGRRAGELRSDVDPRAAAGLLFGAAQHAAVLAEVGGRAFDLPSHARRVWRSLRAALLPPSPSPVRGRPRGHPTPPRNP